MQVGDTVKVIKCNQYKNKYTGEIGEIVREYKEMFGVVLNGRTNHKSSYGCFWFKKVQVEQILNSLEESEDFLIMNMTDTQSVLSVQKMKSEFTLFVAVQL